MTFGGPGPFRSLVLDHGWSEPAASFPNRNPGPCRDSSAALAIQPSRRRHVSPTRRERAGQRRSAAAQRGSSFGPCPALEIASFWLHLRSSALDPGAVESTLRGSYRGYKPAPRALAGDSAWRARRDASAQTAAWYAQRPLRQTGLGHEGPMDVRASPQRVAEPRPSFVTLGSAHRGRRTHVTLHPNRRS
jgi:hypothetical protein